MQEIKQAAALAGMSNAAQVRFFRRIVSLLVSQRAEREARLQLDALLNAPALGVAIENGEILLATGDE